MLFRSQHILHTFGQQSDPVLKEISPTHFHREGEKSLPCSSLVSSNTVAKHRDKCHRVSLFCLSLHTLLSHSLSLSFSSPLYVSPSPPHCLGSLLDKMPGVVKYSKSRTDLLPLAGCAKPIMCQTWRDGSRGRGKEEKGRKGIGGEEGGERRAGREGGRGKEGGEEEGEGRRGERGARKGRRDRKTVV